MWRAIIETFLLFSSPFLAYALFLLVQRRWPWTRAVWAGETVSRLAIAGLLIAIAGLVGLGLSRQNVGAYIPAHVENGKLQPGRFE
jgi:hypothetical protein